MINIHSEQLVHVNEVPAHVPKSTSGKKVSLATCWRWIQRGCRGVKLETLLIGGKRFTSLEALQRFAEATTAAADGALPFSTSTPSARRKAHEKACRELDEAGI